MYGFKTHTMVYLILSFQVHRFYSEVTEILYVRLDGTLTKRRIDSHRIILL